MDDGQSVTGALEECRQGKDACLISLAARHGQLMLGCRETPRPPEEAYSPMRKRASCGSGAIRVVDDAKMLGVRVVVCVTRKLCLGCSDC